MADAKGEHDFATAATATGPSVPTAPVLPTVEPGHYVRGAEIARGGMGRVVAAHDTRLGRDVAVKELLSLDDAARFEREALISARLQHPSIVAIYEAGRWPTGEPFYAMKRVIGDPLDKVIARSPTLDDRLALIPNVLAVFDALAYAHQQQIIHRDLKPANVLVGDYGETVVIDWGLAKDLGDTTADSLAPTTASGGDTVAGAVMGTPSFMPPEQARGESVDKRADVYSLGALLYAVLAQRPPHTGADTAAILHAAIHDTPPPLPAGVPADLVAIVETAMARDPDRRYPSAKELAQDLRRFQTGQLVGAHAYTRGELARRWLRRNRRPVTVAGVMLVASGATLAYAFAQIASQRDRAVASEADKRDALADAQHERDELVVIAARNAIDRDPTRAVGTLARLSRDADPGVVAEAWLVAAALAPVQTATSVGASAGGTYTTLAVSPAGDVIAIDDNGNVDRWHGATRTRMPFALPGRADTIGELAFIGPLDGYQGMPERTLALTSDGTALAWRHEDAIEVWPLDNDRTQILPAAPTPLWQVCAIGGGRVRSGDVCVDTASMRAIACDDPPSPVLAKRAVDAGCSGVYSGNAFVRRIEGGLAFGDRAQPVETPTSVVVRAAQVSRNGRALAIQLVNGEVYGWIAGTAALRYVGEARGPSVFAVSDDGHVAIASNTNIMIAGIDPWSSRVIPSAHAAAVTALAFSRDSQVLYSAGRDHSLRTWRVSPGRAVDIAGDYRGERGGRRHVIAWSTRTHTDGITRSYASVLALPDGAVRHVLVGPQDGARHGVVQTALDDGDTQIAAIYEPGLLYVTDLKTGTSRLLVQRAVEGKPALAFDRTGTRLFEVDPTAIHVWDLATGRSHDVSLAVSGAAWLPGGVAVLDRDTVTIIDAREARPLVDVGPDCTAIAAAPDGSEVAVACDTQVRTVDVRTGAVQTRSSERLSFDAVRYAPDGSLLATAGEGLLVRWAAGHSTPALLTGPTAKLEDVHADPTIIATSGTNVWLWDPGGGTAGLRVPLDAELVFAFDAGAVVEVDDMPPARQSMTAEGEMSDWREPGSRLVISELPPRDAAGLHAWLAHRVASE